MNYISFPVIDIISSQIYCDYLEENQCINSCLREELKREFEENQVLSIPNSEDVDGYGGEYGDGNGSGYGDGFYYVYGYGEENGYGNGYGNRYGNRYGNGD